MDYQTASQLGEETSAWCARAEATLHCAAGDCLAVVRDGIFLRRRWDLVDRESPARRRVLGLLAAAQTVCHCRLAEAPADAPSDGPAGSSRPLTPQRAEYVAGRLAEDDRYLADLLDDHSLPTETLAFAIECFRDDLYWLGTLVTLVEGGRGIDFAGRVLLEQEALQRRVQAWKDETGPSGSSPPVADELARAAVTLRAAALTRRAESLLHQPQPRDAAGWRQRWQAASRLATPPPGAMPPELQQAVENQRAAAVQRWTECLGELPPDERHALLHEAADDLADAASELLTFLEDLPLDEAVRSLEVLAEDVATCLKVVQKCDRNGSDDHDDLRRRLTRCNKAVSGELMQRRLDWQMERLFGHCAVAALERLILALLLLFVVMLAVEGPLIAYERAHWPGSNVAEATCAWLDLGICVVFLAEFGLKWWLAEPRRSYFYRNWLTGLLPAIPVGFLFYVIRPDETRVAEAGDWFVLLRALRYLRLPQMARWLRIARPVLRAGRLIAFVMQASDRMVRHVAPLLNRNLVLFERAAVKVEQPPYRTAMAALGERFQYRASEAIAELPRDARQRLVRARIEDLTAMLSGPRVDAVAPLADAAANLNREIPLEDVIARLLAATPADVSQRIGRTLSQSVARWCRAFDVFGVRRLPLVRDMVAAGRRSSPYGTTAQVANRMGAAMQQWLDRVYWLADLYGTLTAPQLVDSIGDWMVKGTARPARRLLLAGVAFLLIASAASLLPLPGATLLSGVLDKLIAAPLVVLGLLCLMPLSLGLWLRQIAGEATDFCNQVAEAQFISATKRLKLRFARQHHAVLHRRVIAPELEMAAGRATAAGQGDDDAPQRGGDPVHAAVDLLFQDYLDGAPFHHSDTKTTTQLLGNLTLVTLRETRLAYGRRRRKRLRRLDLANGRAWLRGPYLWFHFISRSIAQQTAKLVVDYNANALPMDRAAVADDEQIGRYVEWLSRRLDTPPERLELPSAFARRATRRPVAARDVSNVSDVSDVNEKVDLQESRRPRSFHGSDFTAIHFLCADAELEADVRRRYGDQVARLMACDRRDNIRRVFRTYPLHRLPKEQRTLNPLAFYGRYMAGARVLLLAPRLAWWMLRAAWRVGRQFCAFVGEVLHPTVGDLPAADSGDPFAVAVRKIHRMRKPVFLECLRMRAEFDPEYLGVILPGSTAYLRQATLTPIEEDLTLIDADSGVRHEFRQLAGRRRRQVLEFRRLLAQLDLPTQSPESLRAMAIAYAIDYRQVRSRLQAVADLRRAIAETLDDRSASATARDGASLRPGALWRRWRNSDRIDQMLRLPAFADFGAAQQETLRRLICQRRGPLWRSMRQLTRAGAPSDPHVDARQTLGAIGRDPSTWSRQLVVLRAVQTLSVLDLLTYCELVGELGEYERS